MVMMRFENVHSDLLRFEVSRGYEEASIANVGHQIEWQEQLS